VKPSLYPAHLRHDRAGSLDWKAFPEKRALGLLVRLAFREQIHDPPRQSHRLFRSRPAAK
jgi:hypothetical protein